MTPREVSRTGRGGSTPRDVTTAVATARLTLQIPNFIGTSDSPTRAGNQDIVSPRRSIIVQQGRNDDPFDSPINLFLDVHGQPTSIFSKVIGTKTVSRENTDVYAHERMDFASNSVVAESPNFLDLGLSPANKADKLKSIISPTTRVKGLTDSSKWIASRHGCKEVTARKVSEEKAYSNYIKNSEFETTKVFEQKNISVTRPTLENISMTQPTLENISVT